MALLFHLAVPELIRLRNPLALADELRTLNGGKQRQAETEAPRWGMTPAPASRFSCHQANTEEPIFMLLSAAIKTSTCAPGNPPRFKARR